MTIIEKFHLMETEECLFEMGEDVGMPYWDIVRYSVYVKYYYPENQRLRLNVATRHSIRDFASLIYNALQFFYKIIVGRGGNVVITSSRSRDSSGKYFDRCAKPIIDVLSDDCIIFESALRKKLAYSYLYDFSNIFRRFNKTKCFPEEYFFKISIALKKHFGKCCVTHKELNEIHHVYQSDLAYFNLIFRLKKTKKIFVADGNPKAVIKAAKIENAKTYLIQHAGIEFDEVDYSYPKCISVNSNILFPENVLTFGDYWCKNINVPTDRVVCIGNDDFAKKFDEKPDDSILVISTIIHGDELKVLTKQLSLINPKNKIIYKLHPNEFHFKDSYIEYFKACKNVEIYTNEIDISRLIGKCELVILIVSAVLYEALSQNKKVAIYKRINYERQNHLANLPNIYFIDDSNDISQIFEADTVPYVYNFYCQLDSKKINSVIAD